MSEGTHIPARCPACGHPLAGLPVDAGAARDVGSAHTVCTECGAVVEADPDRPARET